MMKQWLLRAQDLGFGTAVVFDPRILQSREDVRAMCAADRCGAYGKNWTCPPAVGTIEQCQEQIRRYQTGILLQTVGHMSKAIDSRACRETEQRHMQNLRILSDEIRRVFPDALCLGAGGCRICRRCSYPEPCLFPEKAMSSMEAYGLFVTQVCRDAGVPYHHGDRTVTYTACILLQ